MSRRSGDLRRSVLWPALLAAVLLGACATAPQPLQPVQVSETTRSAYERALALMRSEDYEAAIEAMLEVSERNDLLAGPYVNVGIAWRKLGEPEKARAALAAAIERDPANGAAHNQLGLLHRHAGRFDEAREAYRAGIRENPDYAPLYRNLGILCDIYLQNPSCALENFRAYQARTDHKDENLELWIADVERRVQ